MTAEWYSPLAKCALSAQAKRLLMTKARQFQISLTPKGPKEEANFNQILFNYNRNGIRRNKQIWNIQLVAEKIENG